MYGWMAGWLERDRLAWPKDADGMSTVMLRWQWTKGSMGREEVEAICRSSVVGALNAESRSFGRSVLTL